MIKENLQRIQNSLPKNVTLVAVSKTKPIEDLQKAKWYLERLIKKYGH